MRQILHRMKAFYGKNNNFEIFTSFTGISNYDVVTFKLILTSHLTFLSTHLNLLVASFQLPPSVYFYGPSFLSYRGANIAPPSAARSAGDRSVAQVDAFSILLLAE